MIDHAMFRDEGRNILFHVLLQLRWEVTQTEIAFCIVPDHDVLARTFLGMFTDPYRNPSIRRAGRNKGPESLVINLCKLEPPLIEWTVGVVFTLPANEIGTTLIDRASGEHIATQRFTGAARKLFAIPQITG